MQIRAAGALLFLGVIFTSFAGAEAMQTNEKELYTFDTSAQIEGWQVLNDGVMGGLSRGKMAHTGQQTALFTGEISLENNGGFTLTRTRPQVYDLGDFDGIALHIKGDGKTYQLRLRMDPDDPIAYRSLFPTEADRWLWIKIPFDACIPVFRGRLLEKASPLLPAKVTQIGFLISGKQAGPFRLEVDAIRAYRAIGTSE